MANYPIDPTNAAEPTDARAAGYAAEELRALKGYLQTLVPSNAGRLRNRFANGGCVYDQRNSGAVVTVNSAAEFRTLDCWTATGRAAGGVFTVQQIVGGPPGASNYMRCTVTTADAAIPAANAYWVRALLEGFDVADLGWGAAGALPVSIGFWFRSSLTGVFSGTVANAANARAYPLSFNYDTANVWQFIPFSNIPGDTTGVWPVNNVRSLQVNLCLGGGASTLAAPGTWQAGGFLGVTGTINAMATLGATIDLALCQVEAGTVCTPLEWMSYQAGLARVRRYFRIYRAANGETNALSWAGQVGVGNGVWTTVHFDTPMRASPTVDIAGAVFNFNNLGTPTVQYATPVSATLQFVGTFSGGGSATITSGQVTMAVEL